MQAADDSQPCAMRGVSEAGHKWEARDSRCPAATEVKGTETSASGQSGARRGWSGGALVGDRGHRSHCPSERKHTPAVQFSAVTHKPPPPCQAWDLGTQR